MSKDRKGGSAPQEGRPKSPRDLLIEKLRRDFPGALDAVTTIVDRNKKSMDYFRLFPRDLKPTLEEAAWGGGTSRRFHPDLAFAEIWKDLDLLYATKNWRVYYSSSGEADWDRDPSYVFNKVQRGRRGQGGGYY